MKIPKLTRRNFYKKPRTPARVKGQREHSFPWCPDADYKEINMALWSIAFEAGVIIGRKIEYAIDEDRFRVIGKSKHTGKAQDFIINGEDVAVCIRAARLLHGQKLQHPKSEIQPAVQSPIIH